MEYTLNHGFVDPPSLSHLIRRDSYPYLVAIQHWLIEELYKELGDTLAEVNLDVIRVGRGRWGPGTYPTILFSGDFGQLNAFEFEEILVDACEDILKRTSKQQLNKALAEDGIDWGKVAEEKLFRFYDPD